MKPSAQRKDSSGAGSCAGRRKIAGGAGVFKSFFLEGELSRLCQKRENGLGCGGGWEKGHGLAVGSRSMWEPATHRGLGSKRRPLPATASA